ncbi:TraB/GumN family protein [Erythrobacter sp. JK5]|uniref:TraB/GumN family protein n=1 Tax=Erythrobacter sp. JK5 TaxID=2829500 RepID=UPI001BAAE553|nr:TraB/GumN family protein [Erythrobacter sp. JK5]QUL38759.1 TraB/GumN family protein [Erythrobacter sp. JK5]
MTPAPASILERLLMGCRTLPAARWWTLAAPLLLAACDDDPAPEGPPPSPLLLQITSEDGAVEGWMLGTIHALPDDVEWRTPAIERVIGDADLLAVEVANLEDREAISAIFAELSRSTGLPDIVQRLPPSQRADLADLISRAGFTREHLGTTETWAVALLLAQVDAQGKPENGVDRQLIRAFTDREVRELEGAARQLTIFDTLPENDQRDLLAGVVEESSDQRDNPGRLRDAWLAGDVAILEEATTTGIMADRELREALLVERNRDWAAQLAALLRARERPLIAVGAAHLVGPDSVAAMLEQRGYTVTRVGR